MSKIEAVCWSNDKPMTKFVTLSSKLLFSEYIIQIDSLDRIICGRKNTTLTQNLKAKSVRFEHINKSATNNHRSRGYKT